MRALSLVALMLAASLYACDRPTEEASTCAEEKTPCKVATFEVPEMDEAMAKKMAAALAEKEGILKASPEMTEKEMEVYFAAQDVTADMILSLLKKVEGDASLKGVREDTCEAAPKTGCDGCPMKGGCSKKTEATP